MNYFRTFLIFTVLITLLFMPFAFQAGAAAPGPKVSELSSDNKGNKHNLSAKAWPYNYTGAYDSANLQPNPNPTYKATDDPTANPRGQQICIFCHTPHRANVEGGAPLWNRKFSTETFSRYSSATLEIRLKSATRGLAGYDTPAWQPDGSSKLCLSCHDGVNTADHRLGDVLYGGPITMSGADYITGIASFNPSNNKMKTGHHPVSFVYNSAVVTAINAVKTSYALPPTSGALAVVKLDKNSKMQCTTCHNAHQNMSDDAKCYLSTDETQLVTCDATNVRKVAPFWVYGVNGVAATDRDAACMACHPLDAGAGFASPW